MISKFSDLNDLFEEIDANLQEKIKFYVIGGAVMLYHKLKTATKDVDIVVDSEKEFRVIENLLKNISFKSKLLTPEYKKFDRNQIFVRDDYRLDVFQRSVCKGFVLSESMKERAQKVIELKNLTVSLCSITDIFMFKTFTERQGDIDDCVSLAEKDIDWIKMLEEINSQITASGQKIWITYIGERLDLLKDKGMAIPIMNDVNKLRVEFFNHLESNI